MAAVALWEWECGLLCAVPKDRWSSTCQLLALGLSSVMADGAGEHLPPWWYSTEENCLSPPFAPPRRAGCSPLSISTIFTFSSLDRSISCMFQAKSRPRRRSSGSRGSSPRSRSSAAAREDEGGAGGFLQKKCHVGS